eukprot:GEMP01117421.1.p1 GENE.GEMP01117421.1~~GEMP01117421.1.p1  ORF type:complete len:130 (+),score=17.69 GEMP01117421.1:101-490(+)
MMLGFVLLFPAIYAIMGEIQACDHCGLDDNPDLRRFLKGEDEVGRYVNLTRRVSTWQVTLIGLDGRAGGGRGTTARRLTITTCGATRSTTMTKKKSRGIAAWRVICATHIFRKRRSCHWKTEAWRSSTN